MTAFRWAFGRDLAAALVRLLLVGLGIVGLAAPAAGIEAERLRLTFSDDLVSGNEHPDDLYTAELRLESSAGSVQFRLGERMFTRREAGLRFDETFADLSLGAVELRGWGLTPRLGVLRIGKGLAGERAQNEIHRWVGSDAVRLEYVEHRRWYPTFEIGAERIWTDRRAGIVGVELEAYAVPEFRRSLRGTVTLERPIGREWSVRAGVGYLLHHAEFELLRGAVRDGGPTAEIGVGWRGLHLRWSYNDFGTRAGVLSVGVELGAYGRRTTSER